MERQEKFLYDARRAPIECIMLSSKAGNIIEYPTVPLENGTSIIDTWVIHNLTASIDIICSITTYNKLKNLRDTGQNFSLDMDSGQVHNLYISEMNEVNDPSIVDDLMLSISFVQYFHALGKRAPVLSGYNGGVTVNTSPTITVESVPSV